MSITFDGVGFEIPVPRTRWCLSGKDVLLATSTAGNNDDAHQIVCLFPILTIVSKTSVTVDLVICE